MGRGPHYKVWFAKSANANCNPLQIKLIDVVHIKVPLDAYFVLV